MNQSIAFFLVIISILQPAFDIYIFYAFLPLWYGLFQARAGSILAIIFASSFYYLERFRRYIVGSVVGSSISGTALMLDRIFPLTSSVMLNSFTKTPFPVFLKILGVGTWEKEVKGGGKYVWKH